jgi:26S proteasome regulatory subunit N9
METAHYRLASNDIAGVKKAMDECEKILDGMAGVDTDVYASYYRVCADYNKVRSLGVGGLTGGAG